MVEGFILSEIMIPGTQEGIIKVTSRGVGIEASLDYCFVGSEPNPLIPRTTAVAIFYGWGEKYIVQWAVARWLNAGNIVPVNAPEKSLNPYTAENMILLPHPQNDRPVMGPMRWK